MSQSQRFQAVSVACAGGASQPRARMERTRVVSVSTRLNSTIAAQSSEACSSVQRRARGAGALAGGGRALWRSAQLLLSALLLFVVVGCKTHYIPNTDVEDTDFNQRVIDFCEEYRKAVERQNIAMLLKLADESYYEDGGNVNSTDDIDYAGLEEYLRDKFRETRAIRYEIRYRDVSRGRGNVIQVDFTYSASYRIPTHQGEVWRRKVADNRLELIEDGETFRIVRGM